MNLNRKLFPALAFLAFLVGPAHAQDDGWPRTVMLDEGMVTIQVTAIDPGPCSDVSATQTCSALDCPPITIAIDPVDDICLDGNNGTVDLNATVSGSNAPRA